MHDSSDYVTMEAYMHVWQWKVKGYILMRKPGISEETRNETETTRKLTIHLQRNFCI